MSAASRELPECLWFTAGFPGCQLRLLCGRECRGRCDESFVQKLRDRVKGLHKQRREITSLRGALPSVDPDTILKRVARKYGVERQRLIARGERGLQAKNVAMWMIWESGTKSLREIGELFGGLDYAAVAQRIRRMRSAHTARARSNLVREMLNI